MLSSIVYMCFTVRKKENEETRVMCSNLLSHVLYSTNWWPAWEYWESKIERERKLEIGVGVILYIYIDIYISIFENSRSFNLYSNELCRQVISSYWCKYGHNILWKLDMDFSVETSGSLKFDESFAWEQANMINICTLCSTFGILTNIVSKT